jgi:hypothetical protein
MPRRKKIDGIEVIGHSGPIDFIVENQPPFYGVWIVSKHHRTGWMLDDNGNIISSDYIGIVKAQVRILAVNGIEGSVKIIGADGAPMELDK